MSICRHCALRKKKDALARDARKAAREAKHARLLAKPLKAFLVWEPTFLYDCPESWAVYAARTASEARAHGVRALLDAYDSRDIRDALGRSPYATMRAVRCPGFDDRARAETAHAHNGRLFRHHAQVESGCSGVSFPRPEKISFEQRIRCRGYLSKQLDKSGAACERARTDVPPCPTEPSPKEPCHRCRTPALSPPVSPSPAARRCRPRPLQRGQDRDSKTVSTCGLFTIRSAGFVSKKDRSFPTRMASTALTSKSTLWTESR